MPLFSIDRTFSYHEVRLRWCWLRLLAFLRKWGIYIVTGLFVLGSSGSDSVATMTGLMSVAVLPLVWSMQHAPWTWPLAVVAYAAFGVLLCWGMRPLLWSVDWRDIELSLPISSAAQRRSDLIVVAIALAPFFLLCAAGLLKWAVSTRPTGQLLLAPVLLLAAVAGAIAVGTVLISAMRRVPAVRVGLRSVHDSRRSFFQGARYPILHAMLFLPLSRGPARRAGALLQLSPMLLLLHAMAVRFPAQTGWWLAMLALAVQLMTTRLMALLQDDLEPLHAQCNVLPISGMHLRRARQAAALLPALAILSVLFLAVPRLRPPFAIAYVIAAVAANLIEVVLGSRAPGEPRPETSTRISLWLVLLAIQVVLASEVIT